MLPIAALFVRRSTEELARSALPEAPPRAARLPAARGERSQPVRRRVATALRWSADQLSPVSD